MRKILIVLLVLALSVGIASFAMAGDDSGTKVPFRGKGMPFKERPQLQISEDQKARQISLMTQMLELRKEIIQANIENGTLTQEQGKLMLDRLNTQLENIKSGNFTPGMGPGCIGPGGKGHKGLRGGFQNPNAQPQGTNA